MLQDHIHRKIILNNGLSCCTKCQASNPLVVWKNRKTRLSAEVKGEISHTISTLRGGAGKMFGLLIVSVCNAGYYKNGTQCTKCTNNSIKSAPGNATDCSADQSCDGTITVPNAGNTACGKQSRTSLFEISFL